MSETNGLKLVVHLSSLHATTQNGEAFKTVVKLLPYCLSCRSECKAGLHKILKKSRIHFEIVGAYLYSIITNNEKHKHIISVQTSEVRP
jgi:hypothetical protein